LLTLHLGLREQFNSLYGVWMSLYGLMHLQSRHTLHPAIEHVGWFYLACGLTLLIRPVPFTNPWSMGTVFFVGELLGGLVFRLQAKRAEVSHE
jgi:hypothetical protein